MTAPLPPRKPFKTWVLALMLAGAACAFAAAWFSFHQNTPLAKGFGIAALALYAGAIIARRRR